MRQQFMPKPTKLTKIHDLTTKISMNLTNVSADVIKVKESPYLFVQTNKNWIF